MNNVFNISPNRKIDENYDLKGSWIDREVDNFDASRETGKDNNIKRKVLLNKPDRQRVASVLVKDAEFLASQHIMDYSLLLGFSAVHSVIWIEYLILIGCCCFCFALRRKVK